MEAVSFTITVGVVREPKPGNDYVVIGQVAGDGFANLLFGGGFFVIASGDVTSHDSPLLTFLRVSQPTYEVSLIG